MMRNLRPALPVLILLLGGALGVPAGSAQSNGTAKKKPAASKTAPRGKTSSPKGSSKTVATKPATSAKSASAKASTKATAAKPGTRTSSARASKRGSARSRRQPGQKAPTSDRISEIQTALAKDGSFAGTATGKWDDDTVSAMRKFQTSHGLSPTGKLDALTLQKLGLGSQTAGVAAPIAPPGATSRLTSSLATSTSTEATRRQ